jgi:hypothetical protein
VELRELAYDAPCVAIKDSDATKGGYGGRSGGEGFRSADLRGLMFQGTYSRIPEFGHKDRGMNVEFGMRRRSRVVAGGQL